MIDVFEGFLLTPPRDFTWTTDGRHFVDYVLVSERVYELAYEGDITSARTMWLDDVARKAA